MATCKDGPNVKRFNRTRSGCLTCRKRHLKCDETPGWCRRCLTAGIKCDGYSPPKAWMFKPEIGAEGRLDRRTQDSGNDDSRCESSPHSRLLPRACGNALDPFNAAPATLDYETTNYLQFYQRVYEPTVAGCWRPGQPQPTDTLQCCFQDPMRMQGLLLVAASHMEHTAHIERAKGKTSHHINGCIQVVKSHILTQQAVSSALVFIVTHLCAAEGARGNLIASMVHLRGVRDIVTELGGPDKLDDNIKDILIGLDGYRAVQLMQRPLWPCYYDPGSAEENLSHQPGLMACLKESSCVGEALMMHEMWGESHSALQELTQPLIMALRVWQYAWSHDLEDRRVWYWLLRRFQAIRHHMLLTEQCDPLQETLRIAMILWNAMVRSAWGAQKIVKAPVPILMKALGNCGSYTWRQWSTLHQWILSIGAMAAKGTKEEKWFRQELRELWSCQPDNERYQNLRAISKACLYFEPSQKTSLRELCDIHV